MSALTTKTDRIFLTTCKTGFTVEFCFFFLRLFVIENAEYTQCSRHERVLLFLPVSLTLWFFFLIFFFCLSTSLSHVTRFPPSFPSCLLLPGSTTFCSHNRIWLHRNLLFTFRFNFLVAILFFSSWPLLLMHNSNMP